jgi:hypothetical protein
MKTIIYILVMAIIAVGSTNVWANSEDASTSSNSYSVTNNSLSSSIKKGSKMSHKKFFKDCPMDLAFDKYKDTDKPHNDSYSEDKFTSGNSGISGRKPTPDGTTIDHENKIKIYWEDKRPSECHNNSWLSTYTKDPIKADRVSARKDMDAKKITRPWAEARIIIAENDDHYEKKGGRWNDPIGLPNDYKTRLGFRLPNSETDRIDAMVKELENTKRYPVSETKNGITYIIYDTKA